MEHAGLKPRVVIDCSHGNSRKDHTRQRKVLSSAVRQRREGRSEIIGVMMESNLLEGKQSIPDDPTELRYGVSITDACIGWDETAELLHWTYQSLAPVFQDQTVRA
jgi:3-deoxy-7-phosphoheptulonate synthase